MQHKYEVFNILYNYNVPTKNVWNNFMTTYYISYKKTYLYIRSTLVAQTLMARTLWIFQTVLHKKAQYNGMKN